VHPIRSNSPQCAKRIASAPNRFTVRHTGPHCAKRVTLAPNGSHSRQTGPTWAKQVPLTPNGSPVRQKGELTQCAPDGSHILAQAHANPQPQTWHAPFAPNISRCTRTPHTMWALERRTDSRWRRQKMMYCNRRMIGVSSPSASIFDVWFSLIDWCCFYYFVRNSLVALLEALSTQNVNIGFSVFGVFAGMEPTTFGLTVLHSDQLN